MQITQFLVGATFALVHLFISYSVPIAIPYTIASVVESIPSQISAHLPGASAASSKISAAASSITLSDVPSQISSAAAAATSQVADLLSSASLSSMGSAASSGVAVASSAVSSAVASAMASGDAIAWFKKLAFRAAGLEGIAETVRNETGQLFEAELPTAKEIVYETHYEDAWETVHCLNTQGQAFAIWLNVVYLMPLTFLFLRFFIKTYIYGKPKKGSTVVQRRLSEDALRAARKTSKTVERFGARLERSLGDLSEEVEQVEESISNLKKELKEATDGVLGRDSAKVLEELEAKGAVTMDNIVEEVKTIASSITETVKKETARLSDSTTSLMEEGRSSLQGSAVLDDSTFETTSPSKKKGHNHHHKNKHSHGGEQNTPSGIPVPKKGGNAKDDKAATKPSHT